jgi:hypothetical protein
MDRIGNLRVKYNKPGIESSHTYLESNKVDLVKVESRMCWERLGRVRLVNMDGQRLMNGY